jgi:glutamine synthetase
MYGEGRYAQLSELAIHYIGGLLGHASAPTSLSPL